MSNYIVTIRLATGAYDFYECAAFNEFDARQKAGWAFVRDGIVIDICLACN